MLLMHYCSRFTILRWTRDGKSSLKHGSMFSSNIHRSTLAPDGAGARLSPVSNGAHQAESRTVMEYSQAFMVVFGLEVSNEVVQGLTLRTGRTGSLRCAVSRLIREAAMQAPKGQRSPLERTLRVHAARLERDLHCALIGHRGSASVELDAAQEADLSI